MISHLANLLRDNPQEDAIWSCITNTVDAAVFSKQRYIKADLSGAEEYLDCLRAPGNIPFRARVNAWSWIANQIKENLRNNR